MSDKFIQSFFDAIENVSLENIPSAIKAAVIVCMVLVFAEKAIYASSIEILFMSKKEQKWNEFFVIFVIGTIFTVANCLIIKCCSQENIIALGIIFIPLLGIIFLRYTWFLHRVKKCKEKNRRLISYYEEKQFDAITMSCYVLVLCFLIVMGENKNVWSYAIWGGMIETVTVMLINPVNGKTRTSNYYVENDENIYIYKKIDSESFLCGDAAEISNATWYRIVEIEDVKKKDICHEIYCPLSKEEKKRFMEECNEDLRKQRNEKKKQKAEATKQSDNSNVNL